MVLSVFKALGASGFNFCGAALILCISAASSSAAGFPAGSIPTNVNEEIAVAPARNGRVQEGIENGSDHRNFQTRIRTRSWIAVGLGAN